jgi:hypothetical protein
VDETGSGHWWTSLLELLCYQRVGLNYIVEIYSHSSILALQKLNELQSKSLVCVDGARQMGFRQEQKGHVREEFWKELKF